MMSGVLFNNFRSGLSVAREPAPGGWSDAPGECGLDTGFPVHRTGKPQTQIAGLPVFE